MDLLVQFKRTCPSCVAMVLTDYSYDNFRHRRLKLGADHCVNKSLEFENAREVLRTFSPKAGRGKGPGPGVDL